MATPWLHRGYTIATPWLHHGCTIATPWLHQGYTIAAPWSHHGYMIVRILDARGVPEEHNLLTNSTQYQKEFQEVVLWSTPNCTLLREETPVESGRRRVQRSEKMVTLPKRQEALISPQFTSTCISSLRLMYQFAWFYRWDVTSS